MLKKIFFHPFVFFPIAAMVVLWPISTCFFTVKNDALTYYYPVRALISDALNNGELPLWSPFINFGYPIHADMQSGAWSPVVWLFGFLTKFSLAGFHAELLFYFSLAGIGFYYLCRHYAYSATAAIIFGMAYQFSGFMIDSVQFYACISSACWLPFVFLFYKKMVGEGKLINTLLAGFFLYLLFTGGYPSLFIVTAYLLAAHFISSFFTNKDKAVFIKKQVLPLTAMSAVFLLLSLPAIISFLQFLPNIDRGKSQPLSFVLENSMPPAAMFSFISPFATTATSTWLDTDPLMRNVYVGFIPLIFITYGIIKRLVKIKGEARFFLAAALVMCGLAFGKFFFLRQAAYYVLPLMDTFRHPAILRLFAVFFLLLFGAYSFNKWEASRNEGEKKEVKRLVLFFLAGVIFFSVFLLVEKWPEAGALYLSALLKTTKHIFQSLSFAQRFFIQLPFILVILLLLNFGFKNKKAVMLLPLVMLLDIFAATQINSPVTIIGATRFNETVKKINRNTVPFPAPSVTESINENSKGSYSTVTGSTLHYIKKIGRNDYYITPGNLSAQEKFYESPLKEKVFEKPVLFFDNGSSGSISIESFSANCIRLATQSNQKEKLVCLQNNYPGWQAFVDGKETAIKTTDTTFISVQLPEGKHTVRFQYKPNAVIAAWYISLVSLMLLAAVLASSIFFKKHQ